MTKENEPSVYFNKLNDRQQLKNNQQTQIKRQKVRPKCLFIKQEKGSVFY